MTLGLNKLYNEKDKTTTSSFLTNPQRGIESFGAVMENDSWLFQERGWDFGTSAHHSTPWQWTVSGGKLLSPTHTHTVSRGMLMHSPVFLCRVRRIIHGSLQYHLSHITSTHTNTLPETVRCALLSTEQSIILQKMCHVQAATNTHNDFLESEPDLLPSLTSSRQTHNTHTKSEQCFVCCASFPLWMVLLFFFFK